MAVADTSCEFVGLAIQSENKSGHVVSRRVRQRPLFQSFSRLVNWSCSVSHCLTPDARTKNRTLYRGDSGCDEGFWCGRLDDDNAHVIVTETRRRTIHRLPPNQRTDVFAGQGLVRRGGPPKVTLETPAMAEASETLRFGGSSSAGTKTPSMPPETSTAKDARKRKLDPSEPKTSIPSENA